MALNYREERFEKRSWFRTADSVVSGGRTADSFTNRSDVVWWTSEFVWTVCECKAPSTPFLKPYIYLPRFRWKKSLKPLWRSVWNMRFWWADSLDSFGRRPVRLQIYAVSKISDFAWWMGPECSNTYSGFVKTAMNFSVQLKNICGFKKGHH